MVLIIFLNQENLTMYDLVWSHITNFACSIWESAAYFQGSRKVFHAESPLLFITVYFNMATNVFKFIL